MKRPPLDADEQQILAYAKSWVALAARDGFEAALEEMDIASEVPWSQELLDELTFNHFGDGLQPTITDPANVDNLRVDAIAYNDGSGFHVEHDLPLGNKRSDFTVRLDFRKGPSEYLVYLHDILVL